MMNMPHIDIQGLLGGLSSRPMPSGLLGHMPMQGGGLLGGFQPFQPNFGTSPFQRPAYTPQRFAPPNISTAPSQPPAGPAAPSQAPYLSYLQSISPNYQGLNEQQIRYIMQAGS